MKMQVKSQKSPARSAFSTTDAGGKVKSGDRVHRELESVKMMLARALADYDNLSKRVERERQDFGKIASVSLIVRLLPVLDSLENAQVHLKDQGLAISLVEFKKILSEEGLTEVRPKIGEEFNEQTMEAIEVIPGASDNTIAEVVLVGWKFEDGTVVRYAKVKVTKK
jgi:molecular chaperone GrpE